VVSAVSSVKVLPLISHNLPSHSTRRAGRAQGGPGFLRPRAGRKGRWDKRTRFVAPSLI
jgi:hypothetical protein